MKPRVKLAPKKTIAALTAGFLLAPSLGLAAPQTPSKPGDLSELLKVGKIDGESTAKLGVITIRLDRKPSFKNVEIEDHGSFLQIPIKASLVGSPGKFVNGNSPYVTKIAAFQTSESDSAIRIFVNKDAAVVRRNSSAEILGDRIVVTSDLGAIRNDLRKFAGNSLPPTVAAPTPKTSKVEKPGAEATNWLDDPAPAADSLAGTNGLLPDLDIKSRLGEIAAFLGIMFLLLIGSFFVRPLIRRHQQRTLGDTYTAINLVNSLALAPKQKISLVEIGGEKLLLAVSPDSINLLTRIGDPYIMQRAQQGQGAQQGQQAAPSQLPTSIREAFRAPREIVERRGASSDPSNAAANSPGEDSTEGQSVRLSTQEQELRLQATRAKKKISEIAAAAKSDIRKKTTSIMESAKPPAIPGGAAGQTINVGVTDDGVVENRAEVEQSPSESAVDVTKLIREKLKDLKRI